jgi:hypothetical protein
VAAAKKGLERPDAAIDFLIAEIRDRRGHALAGFQPGFILDQVAAVSRYRGVPPRFDEETLLFAVDNLHVREPDRDYGMAKRVD